MGAMKELLASVAETGSAIKQFTRDISNDPGAAPLHAAWRGGLKDLQEIIPAFPDSLKIREEPGSIASPTPQLITEGMTGRGVDMQKDVLQKESHDLEMD
jgi:hypothetical protein